MRSFAVFISTMVIAFGHQVHAQVANQLTGAWESINGDNRIVMICSEKHFAAAVYNNSNGAFVGTCGGTYSIQNNSFVEKHEFNTLDQAMIGAVKKSPVEVKKDALLFTEEKEHREWKRLDDGTPGQLAGAWLITGRMVDGEMTTMTPGARRTMKILSGTRFQWVAYNVDTKEFFGTGGGTYTTKDGKYMEMIEFFSRDNGRVGKNLQFDFSLEDGAWRHKGLSSKGDPIDEVWTKREKLGL